MLSVLGIFSAASIPACNTKEEFPSFRKLGRTNAPTSAETRLLGNLERRQSAYRDKTLTISGRLFDSSVRMESFRWENTEFVNCDFDGCVMLGGILSNVRFTSCMFVANTLDDGEWNEVSFIGCEARGKFNMGTPQGKSLLVENCKFIGATLKEIGFGGRSDQYGSIGGTNGTVVYRKCQFERVYINGGKSLSIYDSQLHDVVVDAQDNSTIVVAGVTAKGVADFGSGLGNFSSVMVTKSVFRDALIFAEAKISTAIFEDLQANLNINLVSATSMELRRVLFLSPVDAKPGFRYGLAAQSAKIGVLKLEDCTFGGGAAALHFSGVKNRSDPIDQAKPGYKNLYLSIITDLTIKNTPVVRSDFMYMSVETAVFEGLKILDTNFSNSRFGKFISRNVTISGKIDFENTIIREHRKWN
jgi:uncharacterized protein YjbI with pentapeptide repeats